MLSLFAFVLVLLGCAISSYGLWAYGHSLLPFLKTKGAWRKACFACTVLVCVLISDYSAVVFFRGHKAKVDLVQGVSYTKLNRLGWEDGCKGTEKGLGASGGLTWEEEVARDEDIAHLTLGSIFDTARRWAGVSFDRCEMLRFMENFLAPYKKEWKVMFEQYSSDMFSKQDARILYAMIRSMRPARVVEIGSGHSTIVGAAAATANEIEGTPTRYEIIEPFPSRVPEGLTGLCRPDCIKKEFLESVPLSHFLSLRRGDILFVDSSHIVGLHWDMLLGRTNNSRDVALEFTELLPRLQPGVVVHVHDIPFPAHAWFSNSTPAETPRGYIEQFVLQALLQHSDLLHPLWFGGALHTPLHTRMGVPNAELRKAERRAKQLFGKVWAGGEPGRPFGGGGSVWLIRTETMLPPHLPPWQCAPGRADQCTRSPFKLTVPPPSAKLGAVLDRYRTWYGVQLPVEMWPRPELQDGPALARAGPGVSSDEDKLVCRVLLQLAAEEGDAEAATHNQTQTHSGSDSGSDSGSSLSRLATEGQRGDVGALDSQFKFNPAGRRSGAGSESLSNDATQARARTVLEIGSGAGRGLAGRWGPCGAGGHVIQGETRKVALSDILRLRAGDVLVYVRGADEARGTPATDGFIVFVTEALPRVPPGVAVVIFGIPFPRHQRFEAQTTAATDDTQFLIQAALIYNRRIRLLSV